MKITLLIVGVILYAVSWHLIGGICIVIALLKILGIL